MQNRAVRNWKLITGIWLPFLILKQIMEKMAESGFLFQHFKLCIVLIFHKAILMFITYEPVPEAHDIFKRFAKVFEQTYTRFLDLQKAEAQAREAQIEAALEKVSSRTMAMHKSNHLQEVIKVVADQLSALGLVYDTTTFLKVTSEGNWELWISLERATLSIKNTCPIFRT